MADQVSEEFTLAHAYAEYSMDLIGSVHDSTGVTHVFPEGETCTHATVTHLHVLQVQHQNP